MFQRLSEHLPVPWKHGGNIAVCHAPPMHEESFNPSCLHTSCYHMRVGANWCGAISEAHPLTVVNFRPRPQLQSCILKRLTASDLRQLHWSVLPCFASSKPAAVLQQSSARRRVKHLGFCAGCFELLWESLRIFEGPFENSSALQGLNNIRPFSLAKVKLVTCHLGIQVSESVSDLGVEGTQLHVTATVDPVDAKSLQGLLDWQALVAALVASQNMTGQGKRCKPTRGKEQQTTKGSKKWTII